MVSFIVSHYFSYLIHSSSGQERREGEGRGGGEETKKREAGVCGFVRLLGRV